MSEAQFQAGPHAILYDPGRVTAVSFEWLDPEFWAMRSAVVRTLGGRGGAVQVNTPAGPAVLRRYLRGGQVARWVRESYVYFGHGKSRSFREFRILAALAAKGLPVPAPLVAGSFRHGPAGRAALMTSLIPEARSLAEVAGEMNGEDWSSLGATLAAFFRAGLIHPDLNATNILRDSGGGWYLIDFDRARLRDGPASPDPMLRRLFRSFDKLGIEGERDLLAGHLK